MLPPHESYAEPFAGGMSVILSKPASKTEWVSDIHPDLVNFWRVVQHPGSRRRLIEMVELTPYSRALFRECIGILENGEKDSVLSAWLLLVTCNQGWNGHAVRDSDWSYAKGISNRNADAWACLPARLDLAGRRLRRAQIECLPYHEILHRLDTPKTVMFLDPPYLPSTRGATKVYEHEFDREQHKQLLQIVGKLRKAKVILCGYRNEMYQASLDGWRRTDFKTKSFAASRTIGCMLDERVLSLWTNFPPRPVR